MRLTVNLILLNPLDKAKTQFVGEIDELDNKKDWIDWITKYGDDISKRFEKPTTELLEGMIDTIIVSPTFALNRDEVEKQVGHKVSSEVQATDC